MKKQNFISKYRAIYRFHSPHGRREAIVRVKSILKELDFFDFRRSINTRTIKVMSLEKSTYMPYWPAFTSVVREMLMFSHNYYISAIRYSDLSRKTIFVDFGAGLAKTSIIAAETGKFDLAGGIEIDQELVQEGLRNLEIMKIRKNLTNTFLIKGNVESEIDISELIATLKVSGIDPKISTIFIFNKNSYGPDVLEKSLELIEGYFESIVYLYQNPIHHYVLTRMGYIEFGQDAKSSIEHKNYKYKLFFKHKYAI